MQIRYSKKLSMRIAGKMKDLAWSNYESTDKDEAFIIFNDDDNNLIGIAKIRFDGFVPNDNGPAINIFLDKFEVNPKMRGGGWGRTMLNWLVDRYNINKITLHHVEPTYDGGKSRSWWKHMGFSKTTKVRNELTKIF